MQEGRHGGHGRKRGEPVTGNEVLHQALIEHSPVGILVEDDSRRILDVNASLCEMFGYDASPAGLVGTDCAEAAREYAHLFVDPEGFVNRIEEILRQKCAVAGERLTLADGRILERDYVPAFMGESCLGHVWHYRDVTERKLTERELQRQRDLLRTIIDSAGEMIFVKDLEHRFLLSNRYHQTVLGAQSQDELLGKTNVDVWGEERAAPHHADDRWVMDQGASLIDREEEITHASGQRRWLSTTKVPLRDPDGRITGLVAASRDVTERKAAEEALRRSEERHRGILSQLEDGYYENDLVGNLTFLNDATCRILGYAREELLGTSFRQYMDEENAARVFEEFNKVYTSGESSPRFDYEITRKDGQKRRVETPVGLIRDPQGLGSCFSTAKPEGCSAGRGQRSTVRQIPTRRKSMPEDNAAVTQDGKPLAEPAQEAGLVVDERPERTHNLARFSMAGSKSNLIVSGALAADANPVSVYLASLSESSRRPMRTSLESIARFVSGSRASAMELAWWNLRFQHTNLIRSTLAETYAPATANLMLSALRGVLRACFRLGYMNADNYGRASDVGAVRGTRLPPGRSIDRGELLEIFRVCYTDRKRARGARDAAAFALLYACGLRRSELVSLDVGDYDPESLEVRVRGKGDKERLVYAEGGADRPVNAWLSMRGDAKGALLVPVNKGDRILATRAEPDGGVRPARMSDQAVYGMIRRRQKEAGVKRLSPHDFRKTFIGDLLDAIGDLSAAQQLAGHANPSTTARYDRRGERAKRKAASHLHVPYFENDSGQS